MPPPPFPRDRRGNAPASCSGTRRCGGSGSSLPVLADLELTHVQFVLLAGTLWLEHKGAPPSQRELADHAGTDEMMTSQVLRTLAKRGLILAHRGRGRRPHQARADDGRKVPTWRCGQ